MYDKLDNQPIAEEEPILADNPNRFVLFPIKYNKLWEAYKRAESSFWTAEEIDLSTDIVLEYYVRNLIARDALKYQDS